MRCAGCSTSPAAGPRSSASGASASTRAFGQRRIPSQVPNLWLYAENDRNYGPPYVRAAHAAFVKAGGSAQLTIFPPISPEGHIFLPRTPSVWSDMVVAWLARLGL